MKVSGFKGLEICHENYHSNNINLDTLGPESHKSLRLVLWKQDNWLLACAVVNCFPVIHILLIWGAIVLKNVIEIALKQDAMLY